MKSRPGHLNILEMDEKFQLKKFGPLSGTGELYVEYAVDDGYFDFDDLDGSIAGLEAIGEEIREYLFCHRKKRKNIWNPII